MHSPHHHRAVLRGGPFYAPRIPYALNDALPQLIVAFRARLLAAIRQAGGMTWNRDRAEAAMREEMGLVHDDLERRCPAYVALRRCGETVRAEALLDMGYNMGVGRAPTREVRGCGLLSFTGTLPLIERGLYEEAAERMACSRWYRQVRRRARAVCYKMQTGRDPESLR